MRARPGGRMATGARAGVPPAARPVALGLSLADSAAGQWR